jgi:orotate phosphoribosyltransferase-like protein
MARQKRWTEKMLKRMGELYEQGLSTEQIAQRFSCSSGTVSFYLRKAGITIRPRRGKGSIQNYDDPPW